MPSYRMKNTFLLSIALCSYSYLAADEASSWQGYVLADALYWQSDGTGLSMTIDSHLPTSVVGHVVQPDFEWDFGFRVGVGILFPNNRWDLSLLVTTLHNNANTTLSSKEGHYLFPQWVTQDSPGYANSAHLHWRLHLGLIDMPLQYRWILSPSFSLTPGLGLRMAIVRQKDNMTYIGGTLFPEGQDEVRMKNKFFGVGPLTTLTARYQIVKYLAFMGSSGFSLNFGEIYLHQDEYATIGEPMRLRVHNIFNATRMFSQISLGLASDIPIGKRQNFHIGLLWEKLYFFGQNELMHFVSNQEKGLFAMHQGDLSVHGVSLDMKWSF